MRRSLYPRPSPGCLGLLLCLWILAAVGCGKARSALGLWPASVSPHSVTLTWTASKSKVAGYNVYRSSPPGVPVKLSKGVVAGTEYTDKTVEPGRSYSYFVTSENLNGLESVPSQRIEVTVPKSGAQAANK